jgi:hypothetical protein
MIKVLDHGAKTRIKDPVTGKWNEMINVRFIEEGRSGGNVQMSESTSFLDSVMGEQTGLATRRIHTHPVLASKIDLFPVGKTLPGHINRNLYSTPQLRQQEGVDARMIDGKLTYFTTYLSSKPEADRDSRWSISETLLVDPQGLKHVQLGSALVEVLEEHPGEVIQGPGAPGEELGE